MSASEQVTNEVLVEEYGFPESARLLEPDSELIPGDYLLDPDLKQIILVGRGFYFHAHKKNRLAGKVRQQTKRKPDADRFIIKVRIKPEEAPLAHQMVLLAKGSRVEIPKGKFGRITENGIAYKDSVLAFTDVAPEQIVDLHPGPPPQRDFGAQKRSQGKKPQWKRQERKE